MLFYRIKNSQLYDFADHEYADDCLTTDIVTNEELEAHRNKVIIVDDELQLNPNYEEEEAQKEQERINNLTLTRGDVFSALIQARMINEATLKEMIEQEMPETTDEEKKNKMLALNALENALNFHRGHALVNEIGSELGISSENLDLFFETNDYHYLLPSEVQE